MLLGTRSADAVGTTIDFLKNFVGGGIAGYVAARGAFALFPSCAACALPRSR